MPKSKLELYEEILSALVDNELSVENIAFLCKMDYASVKKHLDFMEKNCLVQNNHSYINVLYSLTPRGEAVYKSLTKTQRVNKLKESIKTLKETEKTRIPPAE
jgi:predicted transcriptional regulator